MMDFIKHWWYKLTGRICHPYTLKKLVKNIDQETYQNMGFRQGCKLEVEDISHLFKE